MEIELSRVCVTTLVPYFETSAKSVMGICDGCDGLLRLFQITCIYPLLYLILGRGSAGAWCSWYLLQLVVVIVAGSSCPDSYGLPNILVISLCQTSFFLFTLTFFHVAILLVCSVLHFLVLLSFSHFIIFYLCILNLSPDVMYHS